MISFLVGGNVLIQGSDVAAQVCRDAIKPHDLSLFRAVLLITDMSLDS